MAGRSQYPSCADDWATIVRWVEQNRPELAARLADGLLAEPVGGRDDDA